MAKPQTQSVTIAIPVAAHPGERAGSRRAVRMAGQEARPGRAGATVAAPADPELVDPELVDAVLVVGALTDPELVDGVLAEAAQQDNGGTRIGAVVIETRTVRAGRATKRVLLTTLDPATMAARLVPTQDIPAADVQTGELLSQVTKATGTRAKVRLAASTDITAADTASSLVIAADMVTTVVDTGTPAIIAADTDITVADTDTPAIIAADTASSLVIAAVTDITVADTDTPAIIAVDTASSLVIAADAVITVAGTPAIIAAATVITALAADAVITVADTPVAIAADADTTVADTATPAIIAAATVIMALAADMVVMAADMATPAIIAADAGITALVADTVITVADTATPAIIAVDAVITATALAGTAIMVSLVDMGAGVAGDMISAITMGMAGMGTAAKPTRVSGGTVAKAVAPIRSPRFDRISAGQRVALAVRTTICASQVSHS